MDISGSILEVNRPIFCLKLLMQGRLLLDESLTLTLVDIVSEPPFAICEMGMDTPTSKRQAEETCSKTPVRMQFGPEGGTVLSHSWVSAETPVLTTLQTAAQSSGP